MRTFNETMTFFIDCLKSTELQFDMTNWLMDGEIITCSPYEVEHNCGTSACIAGTVAMHIDPSSNKEVLDMCASWIDEDAAEEVYECLGTIFTGEHFWGVTSLDEVTLEDAIAKLESIKHLTWSEFYDNINCRD